MRVAVGDRAAALGSDSIRTQRAVCANNLSRIGQTLASWAADHDEGYPWLIFPSGGGTRGDSLNGRYTYFQFAALSNELVTPSALACPSDGSKASANTFAYPNFRDNNVSYLLCHPSLSEGRVVLSGDRNIGTASQTEFCPEFGSAQWLPRPATNAWDLRIHVNRGHLLFNDGSVEATDNARLRSVLSPSGVSNALHYIAPN